MPQLRDTANKPCKFCVDCKHYRPHTDNRSYCDSPNLDYVDLVTGMTKKTVLECKDLRGYVCDAVSSHCGSEGQWFELKLEEQ